jgi:hypothetical protein
MELYIGRVYVLVQDVSMLWDSCIYYLGMAALHEGSFGSIYLLKKKRKKKKKKKNFKNLNV